MAAALTLGLLLGLAPHATRAQTPPNAAADDFAIAATSNVVLGYILTGDAQTDEISEAGLRGLSDTLTRRTSIEPAAPMAVEPRDR